jgi:hypothetical protein
MMEAERELLSQKLQVFTVMSTAGDNKSLVTQLLDTWNKLVALTYGSELAQTKPLTEKLCTKSTRKLNISDRNLKLIRRLVFSSLKVSLKCLYLILQQIRVLMHLTIP